ncbi:MAG TPA: GNAT family N-acetyltransferase [Fimbriimonas sp.]
MAQLLMLRPSLDDLPDLPPLPEGYLLRRGSPADAESMGTMMTLAYQEPFGAEWCNKTLLEHPDVYATFLVSHRGDVVGTASCLELADRPHVGYVHYVGGHPEHAGKRLGYIATLATLHEFKRVGKTEAILNTDDHRLPAIRVYLQLGFVPQYPEEDHPARWMRIFQVLLGSR